MSVTHHPHGTRHADDLLRPADVTAQYGIGQTRVRRLVQTGELRALRVGRHIKIPRWEVIRYVAANVTPPHTVRPEAPI